MSLPHRPLTAAAAAILLAAGGCNMLEGGGGGGGGNGAAAQSPEVSSQALQAAAREEPLRRFYEARQWQSAWNEQSAQQLVEALRGAVRHGLNPAQLTQEIDRARSPVDREVALSRAALTYADALARGRTDPTRLFEVYTVPRNEADVPGGLAQAVERGNVPEWIESLAPQDEEYRALSQAYVQHMQAMQQQGGGQQANPQGSQQAPAGNQAQAKADQPKEKNSQRRAQQAAPAVPRDRAVVLAVNLERRRWLPRSPDATRIDVNTAASFLRYYRDNAVVDQRVVANGEQGWETPQLASPIYRLVANPDWTVPESIERDELSKLSPAQLQRRNISRKGARMVQEPGPQNALGLVKLDMQNDHAIYLHDTPAKAAFQAADRHVSHGCVRVNDAVGFARMLAEHAGKLEEFNRALANPNRQTTFISLENRIPVRLLYHTAFLDGGQLKFNPDPYGWDATVAQALGLPVPPASQINQRSAEQKRQRRDSDFGP